MILPPVTSIGVPSTTLPESVARSTSAETGPFTNVLDRFLTNAGQAHGQASAAVQDLALGRTDNLPEVMLQVAQADLSFRLILEIRNRLTEAYQEIMKMQI